MTHVLDGIESPLEESFWHRFNFQCRGPFEHAQSQKQIGDYRVDAFFICSGKRIVVELDGKAFHDAAADADRDSWLLHSGEVDEIIRIPYAAMTFYGDATMRILEEWHPEFAVAHNWFLVDRHELNEEINHVRNCVNGDWLGDVHGWLDWADGVFDVWAAIGDFGIACSPKAILKGWDVTPITRQVA